MSKGISKFSLSNVGKLPGLQSIPGISNAKNSSQNGQQIVLQINDGAFPIKGNVTKEVLEHGATIFANKATDVLKGAVSNGINPAKIMRS